MNINRIFNLMTALVLACFLMAMPAPVSADEYGNSTQSNIPNPRFSAIFLKNQVDGYDWPLGADVTISIDDPDPGDLDYAPHTKPVIMNPNGSGQTYVQFTLVGFNLQPGQIVAMTDGTTTKSHTVTNLVVSGVDPVTDTIWGTGVPGSLVTSLRCGIEVPGGCVSRNTTVQSDHTWQVDFSVPGGPSPEEQNLWNIVPGTSGDASQSDEDADSTSFPWYVLNPRINAYTHPYGGGQVVGLDWPAGTNLTLEIDDPATLVSPDYADTQIAVLRDAFRTEARFYPLESYTLKIGDLVTLSGGGINRTHTVLDVVVTSIDIETDIISGTAGPGISQVQAKISNPNISRWVDVVNGQWNADFSVPGDQPNETATCDIKTGDVIACDGGGAIVTEADGDYTTAGWNIPLPWIQVEPDQGWVDTINWLNGLNLPSGIPLTLTVDDDLDPENGYIYRATQLTGPPHQQYLGVGGTTFHVEQDDHTVDLLPGQYITVAYGSMIKTTRIQAVTFDFINEADDTAGGTGPADSSASVWINTSTGELGSDIVIGSDGHWLADFGAEGQDIQAAQDASIIVYEDGPPDEDATIAFWRGPVDMAQELATLLQNLTTEEVAPNIQTPLLAKINNAIESLEMGNTNAAIHQLQAFIHQVEAQRGKKVSEDAADLLISYAQNVIAGIQ